MGEESRRDIPCGERILGGEWSAPEGWPIHRWVHKSETLDGAGASVRVERIIEASDTSGERATFVRLSFPSRRPVTLTDSEAKVFLASLSRVLED